MGLATTATHVIWLAAFLGATGMALDAYFETAPSVREARESALSRARDHVDTLLLSPTFCWSEEKVRVRATNAGSATLDPRELRLVVDGTLAGAFFVDVEGRDNATLWPPGTRATLNLTDRPTEPDRVAIVGPTGVTTHAVHITCPVLTTILVTPSTATLSIGEGAAFNAAGFDQHGQPFGVATFSWSSACGSVTPVDDDSATFVAGTTAGPCALRAAADGVEGTATITILPDAPATLVVSPDPVGVPAGGTRTFAASAYDAYGNLNASSPISWSTNAGSITSGGVLTAQTTAQLGRQVSATSGAASGSATVDVYAAGPSTITLSPTSATLALNATQTFAATVRDAYGNLNATAPVTWSATGGTITQGGVYTAGSTAGTFSVTATSGTASGSASVTVRREAHVDSMATYNNGVAAGTFRKGETVEVRTTLRDSENALVAGASVTIEYVQGGVVRHTATGTTNGAGVASVSYQLPQNSPQGLWTARVASVTGPHYASSANVVSSVDFQVQQN